MARKRIAQRRQEAQRLLWLAKNTPDPRDVHTCIIYLCKNCIVGRSKTLKYDFSIAGTTEQELQMLHTRSYIQRAMHELDRIKAAAATGEESCMVSLYVYNVCRYAMDSTLPFERDYGQNPDYKHDERETPADWAKCDWWKKATDHKLRRVGTSKAQLIRLWRQAHRKQARIYIEEIIELKEDWLERLKRELKWLKMTPRHFKTTWTELRSAVTLIRIQNLRRYVDSLKANAPLGKIKHDRRAEDIYEGIAKTCRDLGLKLADVGTSKKQIFALVEESARRYITRKLFKVVNRPSDRVSPFYKAAHAAYCHKINMHEFARNIRIPFHTWKAILDDFGSRAYCKPLGNLRW